MDYKEFVGIDVAKDTLEVYFRKVAKWTEIQNTPEDLRRCFEGVKDALVVLENTGGYERICLETLSEMGIAVHRTNNNAFKSWKDYKRIRAKTDKIDAQTLAMYGEDNCDELDLYIPSDRKSERVKQLILYVEELKKLRVSEKNRLKSPGFSEVCSVVSETLTVLDARIDQLIEKIREILESDENLRKRRDLISQFKGIGESTAMNLIARLPELGQISAKKLAALSGVAPIARDSGKIKGYRSTRGLGRRDLRRTLFLATLSAVRFNPQLSAFYKKLLARGKRKLVAMVACMRKLIVQLNAIVRDGYIRA